MIISPYERVADPFFGSGFYGTVVVEPGLYDVAFLDPGFDVGFFNTGSCFVPSTGRTRRSLKLALQACLSRVAAREKSFVADRFEAAGPHGRSGATSTGRAAEPLSQAP